MRAVERYKLIEAVLPLFTSLSESEADSMLRAAGSDEVTIAGWGEEEPGIKRTQIRNLLSLTPDRVLEELSEFLPEDQRVPISVTLQVPITAEPVLAEPAEARQQTFEGPIFVVHGHARAVRHEVVRVLERGTGREVIVLHEQPNAGRTIVEKFEDYSADTSFAVVLLTADDHGGVRTSSGMHLRGRQNVIFELGFFFGKLGRQRVAVLLEENVEKPSDIDGLVYITLDEAGAWKQTLARELETAGVPVDRSRMP